MDNIEANNLSMAARIRGGPPDVRRVSMMSPLVLAYIGDTVYDLVIRTALVLDTDSTPHGLHRMAAGRVCAAAQAAAVRRVLPSLTEEESRIYKRGRNSHPGTTPKHATQADYLAATGLEALIGYLYLTGQDARLMQLMRMALGSDTQHNDMGE